jgi:hypothetical protein
MSQKESKKPYGWVLVLRGLAAAAIQLDERPSALRVLCVAAEYMNQDGVCKISQDTIAARLGISRQAVNSHLAVLDGMEILCGQASKDGVLKRYVLDTEGLEDERFGQQYVDERRAAKRAAKKGKFDPKVVAPKSRPEAAKPTPKQGDPKPPRKQTRGVQMKARDKVMHPKLGVGTVNEYYCGGGEALVHFSSGNYYVDEKNLLDPCTLGPPLHPADLTAQTIGRAVYHDRLGKGVVTGIHGALVLVEFSAGRHEKMVSNFVRPILDASQATGAAQ